MFPLAALILVNIRSLLLIFSLISTKDFEKAISYFSKSNPNLRFFNDVWQSSALSFSASTLQTSRTCFCSFALFPISTTDFEIAAAYFSTSNSAFSQTYVLRFQASFSPVKTSFTGLSFRSFRNNFLFRYTPSQKAITPASVDVKSGRKICVFLQILWRFLRSTGSNC